MLVTLLLAAACTPAGHASGGDRPAVVATTTQLGSVAAEIGADSIDLTVLLEPGVEAHDFELTPAAGAALERADVILVSGAGLEGWLEDAFETIGGADRVRDMSQGVELRALADDAAASREDHDDEHGQDHAEGAIDPHYWLDAANAVIMTRNVADALSTLAPESADAFERRADAIVARLERADAEIRTLIGQVPPDRRKIVTDHDALGYFADAYGLEFIGSVFPSLDVSAEPSARQIATLVADMREHDVRAIFTESAVNPRLARALAEETDARVVDEPLYTDSLGPPGSGADTLDGMLLHNARVIHGALTAP